MFHPCLRFARSVVGAAADAILLPVRQGVIEKYRSELMLASAVLVNIAVATSVTYFPYTDIVNHLARYVLMHDFWFSATSPAYVQAELLPSAYIAIDLVGVAMVHLFSPELVARLLTVLYLIALPLGTYLFARAVAPPQRSLAVIAALLSFNWYFLLGFLTYGLSIALALMLMSWWWPRRARMSAGELILFGGGCAGLYLVHMAGAALVLVAAALEYVVPVMQALRTRAVPLRRAVATSRLVPLCVAVLSVALLMLIANLTTPDNYASDMLFTGISRKAAYLFAPFYSFSLPQAVVMAGGYFASLGLLLWLVRPPVRTGTAVAGICSAAIVVLFLLGITYFGTNSGYPHYTLSSLQAALLAAACGAGIALCLWGARGIDGLSSLAILPAALVIVYFLFPVKMFGAYYVDVRFLLPAYLLIFFIPLRKDQNRAIPHVARMIWIVSILHAGVTYHYVRDIDKNLHDFRSVLTEIPKGDAVITLIADHNQYGRIAPYRHFVLWRMVDRAGPAPGLFSGDISGRQLAHFLFTWQPYYPNEDWGTKVFDPLDWKRLGTDYKYILQAGTDDRVASILKKHAKVARRRGDMILYKITGPGLPDPLESTSMHR